MKLKKIDIIAKINWKKETNMQFLPEFIVAIIIAAVHLLISFNLKLPDKHKNKFRLYSIVISLAFIIFLGAFSFSSLISSDQGVNIYFNGLSALYFGLVVPLAIALAWRFYIWIVQADIQPTALKYIIMIMFFSILVGLLYVGYSLYILFFYGFAP